MADLVGLCAIGRCVSTGKIFNCGAVLGNAIASCFLEAGVERGFLGGVLIVSFTRAFRGASFLGVAFFATTFFLTGAFLGVALDLVALDFFALEEGLALAVGFLAA